MTRHHNGLLLAQVVRVFQHLLSGERSAVVKSVKETSGKKPRPLPLNTVEMLKVLPPPSPPQGTGALEVTVLGNSLPLNAVLWLWAS